MIFQDDDEAGVAFADGGLWEVAEFLQRPDNPDYSTSMINAATRKATHGGLTAAQALRVAQEGWHEGTQLVHKLLGGMPFAANTQGVSHWRDDMGGEMPCIPRYLAGEPAHMRRRVRREGNRPVVHIVVNTALQHSSTHKQQQNYGAALCGIIDWLEARGKRVELDRLGVVRQGKRRSFQGWKIKSAADPLDMPSVVFALAHMASHRHLVWGMRVKMRHIGWSPVNVTKQDVARIGAEHALIIDSVLTDGDRCNSVPGACVLAAERLNRAAGEEVIDIHELQRTLLDDMARELTT